MPWTFEQRIQRACSALVDRCFLEDRQIETLRRPLFFGSHAYGVGMSLDIGSWGDWFEVRDRINDRLKGVDYLLMPNRRTYQFNAFSSDPRMLRRLSSGLGILTFNHVRIVDRDCWHLHLPRPRPKGRFYGEFGYRFEFKDPRWGLDLENLEELNKLSGPVKLVTHPRTFLYLDRLSDVLMFKLIVGGALLSLDDRHDL